MAKQRSGSQIPQAKTSVAEAKALIEAEKQQRAQEFQAELQKLCEKYRCHVQTQLLIVPLD